MRFWHFTVPLTRTDPGRKDYAGLAWRDSGMQENLARSGLVEGSGLYSTLMQGPDQAPRLLERIASGDPAAVRAVIQEYGDLVWSLARRFTTNDADAEDAVQDIFTMLWRKAGVYDRTQGAEITFVSLLARRVLIDRWRRSGRQIKSISLDANHDAAAPWVHDDESIRLAAEAFEELEDDQKTAIRLSICFGLTHEMIAEATDTPVGTVKTRIRRGLALVRDRLGTFVSVGSGKGGAG